MSVASNGGNEGSPPRQQRVSQPGGSGTNSGISSSDDSSDGHRSDGVPTGGRGVQSDGVPTGGRGVQSGRGAINRAEQLWHVSAVKNTSVEYYWLDAGWFNGGFPTGVGNWQQPLSNTVDKHEFPSGSIAVLGEAAHADPNPVGYVAK